ncbi:unnamed protein product, partial [Strongylus vulgaris]
MELRLRRMPDAAYNVNSIAAFISIASYVWGLCAFVLVIHTAREIARFPLCYGIVNAYLLLVSCALCINKMSVCSADMLGATGYDVGVVIIVWVILVGAPINAPKIDKIFYCTLFSLNPNAAFSYALKGIADYMNRGRNLSWGNMFEDSSFHFTVGTALLMLLFDIIWMGAAALLFDFLSSDQDFTLFKLPFGSSYLGTSGTRLDDVEGNNETDEG